MNEIRRHGLSRAGLVLGALCIALVAAVWTLTFERIAYERDEAVRDTLRSSANLAVAFEEHIARTLRTADQALLVVKRDFEHATHALSISQLVQHELFDTRLFAHLSVADADGDLLLGFNSVEQSNGRPLNIADRDYFGLHRSDPSLGLVLGRTDVGRVVGAPVMFLTRRLEREDGSFSGVVIGSIDPGYFAGFFNKADLGRHASVKLVGLDGIVRARYGEAGFSYGDDLTRTALFEELRRSDAGFFLWTAPRDAVARYVSYRKAAGFPVIIAVGVSVDEALADFRDRTRNYYMGATVGTLLLLLCAAGIGTMLVREQRAVQAVVRGEALYRATFDEAPMGIVHCALDGAVLRANPRMCAMLDYPESLLRNRSADDLTHPDELAASGEARARLLTEDTGPVWLEKRLIRRDGSWLWTEESLSLVRHPDGSPDYFVSMIQDVSERKAAEALLLRQAHYDGLTELPNRALCYDRLEQAVAHAKRKQWTSAVLCVDLDRFKRVNDTLGHALGDRLLQLASSRLLRCVRAEDTVARVGGDEFVIVLPELASPEDAASIARKAIELMAVPFQIDGHEAFVTASVGIATFPADAQDGETLLKHADVALLRAKQTGRNTYQFYAAEMNEQAIEKLLLENDLRRAMERNEFLLHFQPKVCLATGRITGLEALLRWERPGHRPVSPGVFVPMLENLGLMPAVGDWVIDSACAQLRGWADSGLRCVPVAVNLSAKQFLHRDLAGVIGGALERHGVPADLLEVEITESDAMHNPEDTARVLEQLRERHIQIAIDDFGTGYSSLGYLKRLPVDTLKLDRSFVSGLPHDAEDGSIARAVVMMAHSLGLEVVAEGVETPGQRDFLAGQGCDEMQGYLFSAPLGAAECARLLGKRLEQAA